MSRPDQDSVGLLIPHAWQRFLSSGGYARAHTSIRAGALEVPVDLVARLEFKDDRHLAIHLSLAQDALPTAGPEPAGARLLTTRQRAVVTLIAMGHDTQGIAKALHVSPATVRTHVRNSMVKLGVHTRAQLVAVAMGGHGEGRMAHSGDGIAHKSPV
jgi:DNA-binding NarL/FixJ family response regulator